MQNNWATGDLNRDGVVDLGDLSLVTNNWQQTSGTFLASPDLSLPMQGPVSSVPEPAALSAMATALMGATWRRRSRRVRTSATPKIELHPCH